MSTQFANDILVLIKIIDPRYYQTYPLFLEKNFKVSKREKKSIEIEKNGSF